MKLSPVDISGPHITVWERGTVTGGTNFDIILRPSSWSSMAAPPPIFRVIIILEVMVSMVLMAPTTPM